MTLTTILIPRRRAPSRTGVSRETLEQEEAVREALVDEQLMDYTQASAIVSNYLPSSH